MKRTAVYPFTAIVGQEEMKLSLILNVINPALGGVLIKGEKGTAKSTAVRALAELLPPLPAAHCLPGRGCSFLRRAAWDRHAFSCGNMPLRAE